jgi:hypothetical protein
MSALLTFQESIDSDCTVLRNIMSDPAILGATNRKIAACQPRIDEGWER